MQVVIQLSPSIICIRMALRRESPPGSVDIECGIGLDVSRTTKKGSACLRFLGVKVVLGIIVYRGKESNSMEPHWYAVRKQTLAKVDQIRLSDVEFSGYPSTTPLYSLCIRLARELVPGLSRLVDCD